MLKTPIGYIEHMGLTWSTYSVQGAHVLELVGQLTRMTVLLLEPQLPKLLNRTGSILVIDLAKVDTCDRAGVAMLEAGHRASAVAGVDLRLAAPSVSAGRALHSAGLLAVMPVFDTVDAAARGDALGLL